MHELLTPAQMYEADRRAILNGVSGMELMEAAGAAVARIALEKFPGAERILVVCGGGNNGGDGLVAARILAQSGRRTDLKLLADNQTFRGDAALAKERVTEDVCVVRDVSFASYDLIIDAIFGSGLDRDVVGEAATLIQRINASGASILAVDLPSGIDGETGAVCGVAIMADATVVFFRKKPGHALFPGRKHCGHVFLRQIGISPHIINETGVTALINHRELWQRDYPVVAPDGNKYSRGYTLVVSGPIAMAGAARLAARAALRTGSGLVTIASAKDVLAAHAAQLTSIMLSPLETIDDLTGILADERINCVVVGPGMPANVRTREMTLTILSCCRQTVIDAGALTAFEDRTDILFSSIAANPEPVVLTPHEGEFSRLFPEESASGSKIARARMAARNCGAIVVLKGPDTVVALPDGTAYVADNAPAWLATAGSGDVLAGIIAGLLAQKMPASRAAAAAVWHHGDAARRLGPAMISSDIEQGLRLSISSLMQDGEKDHYAEVF